VESKRSAFGWIIVQRIIFDRFLFTRWSIYIGSTCRDLAHLVLFGKKFCFPSKELAFKGLPAIDLGLLIEVRAERALT
jgi:hypothetical protein